jgi:hypothetical protein
LIRGVKKNVEQHNSSHLRKPTYNWTQRAVVHHIILFLFLFGYKV